MPIELALDAKDDVADVGAVKTFAKSHKNLGGNQLFRGQYAHRKAQNPGGHGTFYPAIVDANHGVAHAGDQVHKIIAAMGLGQPYRVSNLGGKPILLQQFQHARDLLRWKKEIQVFGIAPDPSVFVQGKCARDHKLHPVAGHELNHLPKQRSEEHTSELQSHSDLVCRLLLEKKNKK